MAERLSLEGLRYARAVAETGSFSAAARAYGVTQPALSNGIAKLEEYLGERLFTRSPRGVAQTPFGVLILPLIERALGARRHHGRGEDLGFGSAMLPESKLTGPETSHRTVLDEDGSVVEIFYEAVWDPELGAGS